MVNKRGWMRILEATIAVLLVSTVLILVYSGQTKRGENFNDIESFQKQMLMDISSNYTLRGYVIDAEEDLLKQYIDSKISKNLNYSLKICVLSDPPDPCKNPDYMETLDKEVFADETIISSEITEYSPKKVRLFVWRN